MEHIHDYTYLKLVKDVLENGTDSEDRTGVGTRSVFARQLRFNLEGGSIPLLTTKKMHLPSIIHEIIWYLSGNSNISYLRNNGVRIWNEWASRDGHLGPVYGFQWRHWPYYGSDYTLVPIRTGGIDSDFISPDTNTSQSYNKTEMGIGCIGEPTDDTADAISESYDLWCSMLSTVYTVGGLNESAGTFVDQRWRCFSNFLSDLRYVPGYHLWRLHPHEYKLTPKYYGANSYSINTTAFVHNQNTLHPHGVVIRVTNTDSGKQYFCETTTNSIAQLTFRLNNVHHNNTSIVVDWNAACYEAGESGEPVELGKWKFEHLVPPSGYLYRPRLYVDQIADVIQKIKDRPNDRRIIVSAWNVSQLDDMNLPPCHFVFQFWTNMWTEESRWIYFAERYPSLVDKYMHDHETAYVEYNVPKGELSCKLTQRSADVFLGVPFNIVQYSILTHVIAKLTGFVAKEFIWEGGDVHIYHNHVEQCKEQLSRTPYRSPTLELSSDLTDIDCIKYEDFNIVNYKYHPTIKAKVAV